MVYHWVNLYNWLWFCLGFDHWEANLKPKFDLVPATLQHLVEGIRCLLNLSYPNFVPICIFLYQESLHYLFVSHIHTHTYMYTYIHKHRHKVLHKHLWTVTNSLWNGVGRKIQSMCTHCLNVCPAWDLAHRLCWINVSRSLTEELKFTWKIFQVKLSGSFISDMLSLRSPKHISIFVISYQKKFKRIPSGMSLCSSVSSCQERDAERDLRLIPQSRKREGCSVLSVVDSRMCRWWAAYMWILPHSDILSKITYSTLPILNQWHKKETNCFHLNKDIFGHQYDLWIFICFPNYSCNRCQNAQKKKFLAWHSFKAISTLIFHYPKGLEYHENAFPLIPTWIFHTRKIEIYVSMFENMLV